MEDQQDYFPVEYYLGFGQLIRICFVVLTVFTTNIYTTGVWNYFQYIKLSPWLRAPTLISDVSREEDKRHLLWLVVGAADLESTEMVEKINSKHWDTNHWLRLAGKYQI